MAKQDEFTPKLIGYFFWNLFCRISCLFIVQILTKKIHVKKCHPRTQR